MILLEKILVMNKFKEINYLSEIAKDYDFFFIDLWGVIHNGVKLFDNVIETLDCLKKIKKKTKKEEYQGLK